MRKHKITFFSPGTFVSEASDRFIDSWDTKQAVAIAKDIMERYSAKPYGFKFETLLVSDDVPDGEGGWLKTQSKVVETSGTYFLTGTLETYDEVIERNSDKEDILRHNMHANGYWIVCINTNSYRSTLPFDEKDRIVDMIGEVIERGDDPKYVAYRAGQEVKRAIYYKQQEEKWAARKAAEKAAHLCHCACHHNHIENGCLDCNCGRED